MALVVSSTMAKTVGIPLAKYISIEVHVQPVTKYLKYKS